MLFRQGAAAQGLDLKPAPLADVLDLKRGVLETELLGEELLELSSP